ncbi:hypothetical protein [Candidatus Odyssella thessalonicensis]|uniref:hypothetical protein n=1 Tax=Candidatus Odyssella thessalonicensis TaxID=84647 RepID=UPI000225AF7E|nr:hypothetical protein [Candidatus Odyssella thessalonicensis]
MERDHDLPPISRATPYRTYAKTALKVWWKYILATPLVSLFLISFFRGNISLAIGTLFVLVGAIIVNSLIEGTLDKEEAPSRTVDHIPLHRKYYWNADIAGTPTYLNNLTLPK